MIWFEIFFSSQDKKTKTKATSKHPPINPTQAPLARERQELVKTKIKLEIRIPLMIRFLTKKIDRLQEEG